MSRPPRTPRLPKLSPIFTEPSRFPDARLADEDGVVAAGGELTTEALLDAYRHGIFPWPIEGFVEPFWFSPEERFLLHFEELHVPRSLEKLRRKTAGLYRFSIDEAFPLVIRACAKARRKGQRGTWITPAMVKAYERLHEAGHAHSVEVWEGEALVGGIYGVDAGGAFAGESMFSLRDGASKLALLFLIDHLRARGLAWMDAQTPSRHVELLGGRAVAREEYLRKLKRELDRASSLFAFRPSTLISR